jgi:flavin reductase (DIM6/NTAB) family NADH-FMN oxidoreductase RutF
LPAGLISWYALGDLPVALVTSWVALVGGERPRIRTAWHGRHDPLSRFWAGGDFILNVPHETDLEKVRKIMGRGKLCLNAEGELGYACASGVAAIAPRLLDCAIQIECVGGRLVDAGSEVELCGDVVRMHRDQVLIDPADVPDLCAVNPLSPSESL